MLHFVCVYFVVPKIWDTFADYKDELLERNTTGLRRRRKRVFV